MHVYLPVSARHYLDEDPASGPAASRDRNGFDRVLYPGVVALARLVNSNSEYPFVRSAYINYPFIKKQRLDNVYFHPSFV